MVKICFHCLSNRTEHHDASNYALYSFVDSFGIDEYRACGRTGGLGRPLFGNESAGSASYTELGGGAYDMTVTGAGTDIWGKSDTGRFVFMPLAGDCEIMATIPAIPMTADYGEWAREGLMIRGSLMNSPGNEKHVVFIATTVLNRGTVGRPVSG